MKAAALMALLASLLPACSEPLQVQRELGGPRRIVVAHRGVHSRAAENSLGSLREAIALGVDMVEIDVRTTRDGELVLMHDESVDRTTDGKGDVASLPARAVRALRLRARDRSFDGESVPTLDEAFAVARERLGIYLHVKEASPARIALAIRAAPATTVLVFHDDVRWLERFHEVAPDLPVLPNTTSAAGVDDASRLRPPAYACDSSDLSPRLVGAVRRAGGRLLVDVLGSADERSFARAFSLGADGVQTDEPERLLALLGR